jgi:hypothetical protein
MCAKTHTKYRIAKNGLQEWSDFPRKRGIYARKMAENAPEKAEIPQYSGSENESKSVSREPPESMMAQEPLAVSARILRCVYPGDSTSVSARLA